MIKPFPLEKRCYSLNITIFLLSANTEQLVAQVTYFFVLLPNCVFVISAYCGFEVLKFEPWGAVYQDAIESEISSLCRP
jgi:hypothetical protein